MDINAFFADVKKQADALQPYSDGGIYLMSLDNNQCGTVGGQISVLSNRTVAATHIVNRAHRPAEPQEIEAWKKGQREKAQVERDQQVAKQMRYNLVINAPPNWRPGEPMPVDLAAATTGEVAAPPQPVAPSNRKLHVPSADKTA